jgi:hypothetical protein
VSGASWCCPGVQRPAGLLPELPESGEHVALDQAGVVPTWCNRHPDGNQRHESVCADSAEVINGA